MAVKTVDFHFRRSLSVGNASTSGQQDVGHEGVATGRRGFSLPSLNPLPAGFSAVAFPTGVAALRSNQLDLLITYSFSVVSRKA